MPKGGALRARWKSWNLVCPSCVTHHRSSSKSAFLQKWCEFARLLPPRRARLVLTPRENFQIIFQSLKMLPNFGKFKICKIEKNRILIFDWSQHLKLRPGQFLSLRGAYKSWSWGLLAVSTGALRAPSFGSGSQKNPNIFSKNSEKFQTIFRKIQKIPKHFQRIPKN